MAIANLTQVTKLLKEHFEQPFTESMDRDITLFSRIKRKTGIGKEVQWKIHYAGNTSVASYAESDTIPTAGSQSYEEATSAFKQNWVTIEVTGLADAATRGAGGFLQALANETKEALEDLKDHINDQLLDINASPSVKNIDGLPTIVSDTGTYAGLDRSTYTWWQSYVLDNGGTGRPLTLALMQDVMEEMEKPSRKAKISAILTPRSHFYSYGNLLTEYRRFVDEKTLDGGVTALEFEGIPVIAIPNMAQGRMYFLDEREWGYYVLENFRTDEKSTNTDSVRFIVVHYSQLVCKHPGRQASIDDLN